MRPSRRKNYLKSVYSWGVSTFPWSIWCQPLSDHDHWARWTLGLMLSDKSYVPIFPTMVVLGQVSCLLLCRKWTLMWAFGSSEQNTQQHVEFGFCETCCTGNIRDSGCSARDICISAFSHHSPWQLALARNEFLHSKPKKGRQIIPWQVTPYCY